MDSFLLWVIMILLAYIGDTLRNMHNTIKEKL
jgi:hypothetical protein